MQKIPYVGIIKVADGDDIQTLPVEGKTFRDYVTEYMAKAQDDRIHRFAAVFGLDETLLRGMMSHRVTEGEHQRFWPL